MAISISLSSDIAEEFLEMDPYSEAMGLRDRFSKHYALPDGSFRALIFGGSIHYFSENGDWREILTDLAPSTKEGYAFENTTNNIKSYFPKVLNRPIIIYNNDYQIEIMKKTELIVRGPDGIVISKRDIQTVSSKVDGNKILYKEALEGIDLEFSICNDLVKKSYILNNCPTIPENGELVFKETVRLLDGCFLGSRGQRIDGSETLHSQIEVYNRDSEPVFVFPIAEIFEKDDPSDCLFPDGADYGYRVNIADSGRYIISISVPSEWLNATEREYPVVIDPSVTLYGDWGGWMTSAGGYLENNPMYYVYTNSTGSYRAWSKFTTTSIPDASIVTDVDLRLYCNGGGTASAATISIYDVTGSAGPYGGYNSTAYSDFATGYYTAFTCTDSFRYYGYYDLGTSADSNLQSRLSSNWFQIALINSTSTWKRFTSNLSSIYVTYTTASTTVRSVPVGWNFSSSAWGGAANDWDYEYEASDDCADIYNGCSSPVGCTPSGGSGTFYLCRDIWDRDVHSTMPQAYGCYHPDCALDTPTGHGVPWNQEYHFWITDASPNSGSYDLHTAGSDMCYVKPDNNCDTDDVYRYIQLLNGSTIVKVQIPLNGTYYFIMSHCGELGPLDRCYVQYNSGTGWVNLVPSPYYYSTLPTDWTYTELQLPGSLNGKQVSFRLVHSSHYAEGSTQRLQFAGWWIDDAGVTTHYNPGALSIDTLYACEDGTVRINVATAPSDGYSGSATYKWHEDGAAVTGWSSTTYYDASPGHLYTCLSRKGPNWNQMSGWIRVLNVNNTVSAGYWVGDTDNNWDNCLNWGQGKIPDATVDVIIPSSATNWPQKTGDLTIGTNGRSITMIGFSQLSVTGNWVNNGTFSAANSTVKFEGTSDTYIRGTSMTTFNEVVIPTGKTVYVDNIISSGYDCEVKHIDFGSSSGRLRPADAPSMENRARIHFTGS